MNRQTGDTPIVDEDKKAEPMSDVELATPVVRRALRHVQFVLKKMARFARMSSSELRGHFKRHPNDWFRGIEHPAGGHMLHCDTAAWDRLWSLAELARALDEELLSRVSKQQAFDQVRKAFTQCILELQSEPGEADAARLLAESVRGMRECLVSQEHHFPCIMFVDREVSRFSVGPVSFTRQRLFFRDRKEEFQRGTDIAIAATVERMNELSKQGFNRHVVDPSSAARRNVRDLKAAAFRQYRKFPWVASVQVSGCDSELSRERGYRAAELALHVIRVLLGARGTRGIQLAWPVPDSRRSAHLFVDSSGHLHSEIKHTFAPCAPGWSTLWKSYSAYERVLGGVLGKVADPTGASHLHLRLIDAIAWFGDGATDRSAPSSIVKYVSAIERLLFGQFDDDRTKNFAKRVYGVLRGLDSDEGDKTYQLALRLYRARSAILHGELSSDSTQLPFLMREAEELSRMCLLASTQLYPMMVDAFQEVDANRLEEVIVRVCEEGVDWLAAQAGWCRSAAPPR